MSIPHRTAVMAMAALTGMFLAGCATNMTDVREKLYHEDGTPMSEFAFRNSNIVTWGSKQDEGTGQMSYTGDGWKLDANGGAKGQEAGEINASQLMGLLKLLEQLNPPTPPIPAP